MSFLELQNLTKTYRGNPEPTVRELDLDVEQGEIVVLLGASGCGKTTILKMIAGLEKQDDGHIHIDGELMDGIKAEKRPIAMVFQKALLFNNMTVAENINFAPRLNRSMNRRDLARETERMLSLMRLDGLGKKKVTQISGGQEQRVSLARALMTRPKLLLLDEPLSALDAELRISMREHIRMVSRELSTTMIFVTHDQDEALALADRIALMFDGRMAQYATPEEFYRRPASREVASFFGWKNFLAAKSRAGVANCALGGFEVPGADGRGMLAIRPEAAVNIGGGALSGLVQKAVYQGTRFAYKILVGEQQLELSLDARYVLNPGDDLRFDLDPKLMWMVADGSDTQRETDNRSQGDTDERGVEDRDEGQDEGQDEGRNEGQDEKRDESERRNEMTGSLR